MIRHFESRLADFIGSRLDPPFQGRVSVPPASPTGGAPAVTVEVVEARPLEVDFGSRRPELAPGADDPRRVVRLECDVTIAVQPANSAGRAELVEGLDAIVYLLDDPVLRRPASLDSPAEDPGFVLESMRVAGVLVAPESGIPRVALTALGWFWPPDAPGITGEPITATHIRAAQLPVSLAPWPLRLRPGGDAVSLTVQPGTVGTVVVDGETLEQEEFGELVMRIVDAGGRPGAGTLTGGSVGPAGARIVARADGAYTVEYTPPAESATDHLVVAVARPDGGDGPEIGVELARFALEVAP